MKKLFSIFFSLLAVVMVGSLFSATSSAANAPKHDCNSSVNACIVCNVADKINALPAADDITAENAEAVAHQIHAIDSIKTELTDEQYDELLTLVDCDNDGNGLNAPVRYTDALNKLLQLDDVDSSVSVMNSNVSADIIISVVDSKSNALEGAKLRLLDSNAEIKAEWVSAGKPHEITGLTAGAEYTLHVTEVPDGYEVPEDTVFTIGSDGKIADTNNAGLQIKLDEDYGYAVQIGTTTPAKYEITYKEGGKQISFGTFTIEAYGTNQNSGYKSGIEYTVTFLDIPAGAVKPEPYTFSLTDTGELVAEPITGSVVIMDNNCIFFLLHDPEAGNNPTDSGDDPDNNSDTNGGTSDTGDDSSLFPWFAFAFISGACLIVTIVYGKKRKSF